MKSHIEQKPIRYIADGDEGEDALPEILRVRDVAEILGVTVSTLYRWRAMGRFPSPLRIGVRRVAYTRPQISEWLQARPSADESA